MLQLAHYLALDGPAPSLRLAYGSAASAYVELFLPEGDGPFPVVVLVHGGCWCAAFGGIRQMRGMAGALQARGMAVWNVEYRCVDQPGGGYPGMYHDMHAALDLLAARHASWRLDLERLVAVGHSAGGHLVQWLAGCRQIAPDSPLYRSVRWRLRAVLSLGGLADLRHESARILANCGRTTAELAGVARPERPDVFADTNPLALMPPDCPSILMTGELDRIAPPRVACDYARRARQAGASVAAIILPGASHYDVIAVSAPCWPRVLATIERALKPTLKQAQTLMSAPTPDAPVVR